MEMLMAASVATFKMETREYKYSIGQTLGTVERSAVHETTKPPGDW